MLVGDKLSKLISNLKSMVFIMRKLRMPVVPEEERGRGNDRGQKAARAKRYQGWKEGWRREKGRNQPGCSLPAAQMMKTGGIRRKN